MNDITIIGASQNNLKNIDITIPKHLITVFTGRSGSGKSSLVFNTIAAESEQLLNESYSSYIQFYLNQQPKKGITTLSPFSFCHLHSAFLVGLLEPATNNIAENKAIIFFIIISIKT